MALVKCSECGKEVSNKAEVCPNCGHEIRKKTSHKGLAWVALIAIGLIFYSMSNSDNGKDYAVAAPADIAESSNMPVWTSEVLAPENEGMAWQMAKGFVKKRLKSPSTADFPWSTDIEIEQDGHLYTIDGYVDAQNTFGAKLRKDFTAKVRDDGNGTWSLIDLKFK